MVEYWWLNKSRGEEPEYIYMSPSLALRCPLLPRILFSRSLPDVTPWLWTKTVSKINFFSLSSSLSVSGHISGYIRENSLHSGTQFLRDKRCNTQLLVNGEGYFHFYSGLFLLNILDVFPDYGDCSGELEVKVELEGLKMLPQATSQ